MIMWVARADELVSEEIAVLHEMVKSEADRLGIPADSQVEQDVAAALCLIEPTPGMVDTAARMIVRDEAALSRLGGWIKLVTYADGKGTEAERLAIARVTDAFAKTREVLLAPSLDASHAEAVRELIEHMERTDIMDPDKVRKRYRQFAREASRIML